MDSPVYLFHRRCEVLPADQKSAGSKYFVKNMETAPHLMTTQVLNHLFVSVHTEKIPPPLTIVETSISAFSPTSSHNL